jgi:RecA-family ATPase
VKVDEAAEETARLELASELSRPPWVIGAREMLERARLQPEWLVPGMIPARDLTLVTGAPGAMKSWLVYSLAVAVAQGTPWMALPVMPGPVLVCNYDNSSAECGRRFLRLGLKPTDSVSFHSLDVGVPWKLPEAAEKLAAVADFRRPSLIVIDTLRQAHTAEENSSKEMGQIMAQLKRLYACGAAVVVVHHSGKGPMSTGARGSQEIDGSATAIVHVAAEREDRSTAQWVKHRSWPMAARDETRHFRVSDSGDRTIVERIEPPKKREG